MNVLTARRKTVIDNLPTIFSPTDEKTAYLMSPITLAFVGDAVQQLYVKTSLATSSDKKNGELHKLAILEVKASSQAAAAKLLLPHLTERETDVFKRARNHHASSPAKNASIGDYKNATGFEAVIGYLYLSGNTERLEQIFKIGYEK